MYKIAMINFDMSTRGGSQQVLTNMVHSLEGDYEFHVISLISENPEWAYSFSEGVACETILPCKARIRETIRRGKRKLNRYLKENRIDLVFYVGAYAGLCAGWMARGQKCKKVFCDHGALMNQWGELPARMMRTAGSRFSHRTVVLTKQSEEAYYEKFHYKKGRVLTIYNWIDDEIRKNAGEYDTESRRLITAGRFSHEKGYDLLLLVAQALMEKTTDWEWDIYGEGDMFDEIQEKVREMGLEKHLHLLGGTDRMSQCYRGHALYVMTSYREGLPLVLLEAKTNHLPIVSFDIVSGPAEIVTDGEDGILIPPYETEKMAEEIAGLLANKERRVKMAGKSENRVELFEKGRILEKWQGLIRELLY
ncbi:MAG: glycosyltransferase [Lachnospiraceae bacterium]|nr:glycosyltransferase [Lachnospiraceae bacterium]